MSSWAICTPRSFLASSSRSTSRIWRPSTPPALLISSVARRTPSRMLTPIDDDPPVKGPATPILIGSWACTPHAMAASAMAVNICFMLASSPLYVNPGVWAGCRLRTMPEPQRLGDMETREKPKPAGFSSLSAFGLRAPLPGRHPGSRAAGGRACRRPRRSAPASASRSSAAACARRAAARRTPRRARRRCRRPPPWAAGPSHPGPRAGGSRKTCRPRALAIRSPPADGCAAPSPWRRGWPCSGRGSTECVPPGSRRGSPRAPRAG
mmetsp:Transcript_5286/g.19880  ORF Transcript_5286/g.19880 Transcript_5286/m.19880 type:complete len:266 (-) Transcript_5286:1957-2754(-)